MSDDRECPNCGTDLTDTWMEFSVTWYGEETAEASMPCPECGRNLAEGDQPELVSGGVSLFDE